MADPYPNQSANTIYSHLRSLSNTIGDLGDIVTSLHFSTIPPESTDTNMPSFSPPGSIRRRILRIISFGRYSSRSADDTEPLTKAHDPSRRHSAPPDVDVLSNERPTYTARQSSQSSDSAQTTIVHGVPPGTVPFSIDALRDQHQMSDTEFDTPSQPEAEPETVNSTIRAEEASWDPTRLRRNKSIMHCNICNRIWEYNQIHCPGCAARTLHHIPGSSDDSYTDSESSNDEPRTLHHRPVRYNPERDVLPTESSWDAHELEAGTAEESWATTAADTTSISASPKPAQASTEQSTETHPAGKASHKKHRKTRYSAVHCCYSKPGVVWVYRCCCADPSTHGNSSPELCTQSCILHTWPITAAVIFGGPVSDQAVCRCLRCGCLHSCGYVEIVEDENQRREWRDGDSRIALKKERSWWIRLLKWFCCCCC